MRKKIVKSVAVLTILLFILNIAVNAQKKEKIDVTSSIPADTSGAKCKSFIPGSLTLFLQPEYPSEAKTSLISGTVSLNVVIDETGKIIEIKKIEGNKLLQDTVLNAVQKVRFSPTLCDGIPKKVSGVLSYNFILFVLTDNYFKPEKIEDFADIKRNSSFYESILDLTENYQIAFGYADKNYHAEAPLTRGDFAHSLRLTLDLLTERAKIINKSPVEIALYFPYNPQKLTSVDKIKDISKKKSPFYDSLNILLETYKIAIIPENKVFNGNIPMTQNEVIDLWSKIFTTEAVPVNFETIKSGDRIFTRGEFALFLQESLGVLTYKVLP